MKTLPLYHLPLLRPWTWALTDAGLRCLFYVEEEPARDGRPGKRHNLQPTSEVLGSWVAIYALPGYDATAPGWVERASGLVAPPAQALPGGCYVAVGRLTEVGTIANDPRCYDRAWRGWDRWWAGAAPIRGIIAWWLEEVVVIEPMDYEPPPLHLPRSSRGEQGLFLVDGEALPELRERVRLARDGVWRHPMWKPPPAPVVPVPAPVVPEVVWESSPPLLAVEQLEIFSGASSPPSSQVESQRSEAQP